MENKQHTVEEPRLEKRENKVVNLMMRYNAVVILVALIVISSIMSDVFFTPSNIFNLLRQNVPLAMASLGMLLVVLTGGIDLSVGSVTALGGMICGTLIANHGLTSSVGLVGAILLVLLVGAAVGAMSGFFVVGLKMAPFVATLATMTMMRGAAFMISFGQPIRLPHDSAATDFLNAFGSGTIPGTKFPWPVLLAILIVALFVFIMNKTVFGRLIIASGSNETAVRLAGISVNKYKFFAYVICGLLCTFGGIVTTSRVSVSAPAIAEGMELDAIAACVIGGASLIGGRGTVGNTIIGVLVLGLIMNVMSLLSIAAYPQQVIKGVIIVLAVFMQYVMSREKSAAA
ncbi:MAG: ABC transporter permease [Clostridiales Family XIII bacterium]|jgi:ribose transport system permease protein|nr:ABC transporter permease [Clostridiales Family XIII bacterium]